ESKAVFNSASPTAFTKWNKDKSRMEPYVNTIPTDIHNLDMNNLGNKSIQQWLIEAPHLKISLADGSWVALFPKSAIRSQPPQPQVTVTLGAF
ncbi:hypothetical protein, partial [Klebsiella quasivariicola]|uniref:hypothetical protein n=1 Tax=Klebsiella quasivariicola TaxID=2026240 RepID=UPI002B055842